MEFLIGLSLWKIRMKGYLRYGNRYKFKKKRRNKGIMIKKKEGKFNYGI